MKILLYCPLNPSVPRVYARTLQSILTQEWPHVLDIVFGKRDGDRSLDDLTAKHNRARKLALAGGYDALFLVEADMIIPPDALLKLADIETDVAYGLYVSRHGSGQWLAFDQISKNSGKSINRNRKYCADKWGKVIETQGVGMGCTLINRRALEALEFRRYGANADDWYFSLDCIELGIKQYHHLGVVCGHIDGRHVLWPSLQYETMLQTEPL